MPSNQSMQAFVIGLLKEKIPACYYYHNYTHTLYVMEKAVEIGQQEHCTEKEIELLGAAALWHDSGFINTYANHEKAGCLLARQYLPEYNYSAADIDTICGMIMATKMPQSPKNKLEEILADADLEYLGTFAVNEKAANLFKELQYLNPALTKTQWQKTQISFLQSHQYFTRFCKENREPVKHEHLWELVNNIG